MNKAKSRYHGYRFSAAVISRAARWYFAFSSAYAILKNCCSNAAGSSAIRRWCDKFGASFAHRVKSGRRKPGSTWRLDEVFVTLRGEPYLLWRAVDQHRAELDILLQKRRDKAAAKRFFTRVLARVAKYHARSSQTSFGAIPPRRRRSPS
jgi:putative transposase